MAHFSDCGAQCADLYCRQRDFLPIKCNGCDKAYCSEHFKYDAHGCPGGLASKDRRVIVCPLCSKSTPLLPGADENEVFAAHVAAGECKPLESAAARPRCAGTRCREKLTSLNSLACSSCGKQVCLKHRFEDMHECTPVPPPPRPSVLPQKCRESAGAVAGGLLGQASQQFRRLVK